MRNSLIFYPLIKSKVEIFAFNLKIFHSHLCADFDQIYNHKTL
jgi:hypothetical protein